MPRVPSYSRSSWCMRTRGLSVRIVSKIHRMRSLHTQGTIVTPRRQLLAHSSDTPWGDSLVYITLRRVLDDCTVQKHYVRPTFALMACSIENWPVLMRCDGFCSYYHIRMIVFSSCQLSRFVSLTY
jgi:hypothetical protein